METIPHITTKDLGIYMRDNYSYISHNLSSKEVKKFIKEHQGLSLKKLADYFQDYLLSQGLADVQE